MDVLRAEKHAQDMMVEARDGEWDMNFILILDEKSLPLLCTWVDPYFGVFTVYGKPELGVCFTSGLPETASILPAGV